MMKATLYLPALCFFLLLCGACTRNDADYAAPDRKEMAEDSSRIVGLFEQASVNPAGADSLRAEAKALSLKNRHNEGLYAIYLARFKIQTGKLDTAKAIILSELEKYKTDSMSLGLAQCFNLLGSISAYRNNQEEAVTYFGKAIRIYDALGAERQSAAIKFNVANIFFSRMDYGSAYKYGIAARTTLISLEDTLYLPFCEGICAVAAINLGKPVDAITYANNAKNLSKKYNNILGTLIANYALGEIEAYHGNHAEAIAHLSTVLELSERYGQKSILLPSYTSLLRLHLQQKNYREAIGYGEKALSLANILENKEILYSINKNLAYCYEGLGQYGKAFKLLKEAEQIYRDNIAQSNQQVIHELLIQYDDEKKTNTILQQDNNLARQRVWIILLSASALLLVSIFLWYLNFQRQKSKIIRQEKEKELMYALSQGEEKERKRLAGELHDGIASNLVAIKLQLENYSESNGNVGTILELVKKTHTETRKVAHNLLPVNFSEYGFSDTLRQFCENCHTETLPVYFQSNMGRLLLDSAASVLLFRAVQEFVQNAIKHAKAERIDVQVMEHDGTVKISIEDDGVGFDSRHEVGLIEMKARLDKIRIASHIDSRIGRGTSVFIEFKNS